LVSRARRAPEFARSLAQAGQKALDLLFLR